MVRIEAIFVWLVVFGILLAMLCGRVRAALRGYWRTIDSWLLVHLVDYPPNVLNLLNNRIDLVSRLRA